MAKKKHFNQGDYVSGKRWNGQPFIGVYEHEYDCGDHSVFDGEKHICVHKNDCKYANEEESTIIKEMIDKTKKPKEKKDKKKPSTEETLEELLEQPLE